MVGFAVVIVVLSAGMVFALRRIELVTNQASADIRAKEHEITLVERLRLSGELVVSAGRGYVISDDPAQLTKVRRAQADFGTAVRALRTGPPASVRSALVAEVERAAAEALRAQEQLLNAGRPTDRSATVAWFENEMRPSALALREALDRLVGHETAALERVYSEARQRRAQLMGWVYGLLVGLVLVSVGVAWYFAQRLARTYRREADALETARKALIARDEVMGIVAHDLRSPLGAIMMKAELLAKTIPDEKTREHAASINSIATRMANLISMMLDVAVIEEGKFTVSPERCDVDELLREAFDLFATLAASKSIRLEQRVSERGLVVQADRERIFQVLSNLLGNAIKFTPPNGLVTLSVERSGGSVRFEISDTGPGIARDHIPHVFDRYWKHEARGTKGTGLGLFIAKGVVDAHGGQIGAESAPGDGATFYFTLPLPTPDNMPAETRATSPDPRTDDGVQVGRPADHR